MNMNSSLFCIRCTEILHEEIKIEDALGEGVQGKTYIAQYKGGKFCAKIFRQFSEYQREATMISAAELSISSWQLSISLIWYCQNYQYHWYCLRQNRKENIIGIMFSFPAAPYTQLASFSEVSISWVRFIAATVAVDIMELLQPVSTMALNSCPSTVSTLWNVESWHTVVWISWGSVLIFRMDCRRWFEMRVDLRMTWLPELISN